MNRLLDKLSPSITDMIRLDHAHVETAFRQFEATTSARVKKGLVDNVLLALEIHAQLEEEIFYPAMREVSDTEALRKSPTEHNEMRQVISRLRGMQAGDIAFDETVLELARLVKHHVADEETQLLPAAERIFPQRLGDLGARMTRRRIQLMAPRSGELAGSVARSMSVGTLLAAAGAVIGGAYLLARPRPAGKGWTHGLWSR